MHVLPGKRRKHQTVSSPHTRAFWKPKRLYNPRACTHKIQESLNQHSAACQPARSLYIRYIAPHYTRQHIYIYLIRTRWPRIITVYQHSASICVPSVLSRALTKRGNDERRAALFAAAAVVSAFHFLRGAYKCYTHVCICARASDQCPPARRINREQLLAREKDFRKFLETMARKREREANRSSS